MKTSSGGVWAYRQMRELIELDVDVHVALPPGGAMENRYRDAGVTVHEADLNFPAGEPWRWGSVLRAQQQLVSSVQPDVIHSHFVGTTLTMRLALGREHPVPRVFQVPGPLHLEFPWIRRLELATAGPADYWIAASHRTQQLYLAAEVPAQRVSCSFYGHVIDEFAGRSSGRLRGELGLDSATPIVGMVAFIYPPRRYLGQRRGLKGHEDLIDAVALCLKLGVDLRCVMVGGAANGATGYEARIRQYARDRCGDKVVLLGTRSDVLDLYRDFDVAVHPSHSENHGGAPESLLSRVPTIATNVGGFSDLVTHGETGWLVPPRQPAQLALAIQDALRNPARARQLALNGYGRARELCDVKQTTTQVQRLYQRLAFTRAAKVPAR